MKKISLIIFIIIVLLNTSIVSAFQIYNTQKRNDSNSFILDDYDPLVDISIYVDILAIRPLDKIDPSSDPDFFIKIYLNNEEFVSPIWHDTSFLYNCWNITKNIADDVEIVNIKIELWDWDDSSSKLCDISGDENYLDEGYTIELIYNLRTGLWYGDDYNVGDPSGFGRLCGCDDGSIYQDENDCEFYFNIYQNDYDNDGLPYWIETNVYKTDPTKSNLGEDKDNDSVPIEWEHRWGFNPLLWEDHNNYDSDEDSLNNTEEYLASAYGTDPFRKDLFLEMDFMEDNTTGEKLVVPDTTFELMKDPFNRRNIVFHIEYKENQGGELIPFDDYTERDEIFEIYNNFFIKNDTDYWRRGVFHYGILVFKRSPSFAFSGDVHPNVGYLPGTNSYVISYNMVTQFYERFNGKKNIDFLFATSFVHELGHNFGLRWGNPFGVDCQFGRYPWQFNYWFFGRYKSIMNYRYVFEILDFSDGSHGFNDHDDWENIDLTFFEIPDNIVSIPMQSRFN